MFDNIFTEVDYTNVQWKRDIEVESLPDQKHQLAKKRDTYRILKNVAQRNNDQPQALIFYAKEMENHFNETSWKTPLDKLILVFNKITNNFGMNWLKPIMWLIGLSITFYSLLGFSTSSYECAFADLGNYFVFLNPAHKTEFIAEGCWSFWTYCIDFLFRVIEALLIYQMIQAFRKYTRKL